MKATHLLSNRFLKLWAYRHYQFFMRQMPNAINVQKKILLDIINKNQNTIFGKDHYFSEIKNIAEYQSSVPIRIYEDFSGYIDKIKAGQNKILTDDEVILFEPTGGSTGGSKLIPYTSGLKTEFAKSIGTWLYDIFRHYPSTLNGSSYWSISPITHAGKYTPGGTPIGFDSDTEYLGLSGKLMSASFSVPEVVRKVQNIDNFRQVTSYLLLLADDLRIISVWNPTFLSLLLEHISENSELLIKSIYDGKIYLNHHENIDFLKHFIKKSKTRANELTEIFNNNKEEIYNRIWPNLKLISCWTDGSAAQFAKKIDKLFQAAFIQGKGLLATEAFITLPITKSGGCIPAFTSHFLEFISVADNSIHTMEKLELGQTYSVMVTTSGGLYRYNLGDLVTVSGNYCNLPILKFLGRSNTSDLVGEKLHEHFVREVLLKLLRKAKIDTQFVLLAPVISGNRQFYSLFLKLSDRRINSNIISELADWLDKELKCNFHYKYAREINQLDSIKAFEIIGDAQRIYEKRCLDEGQKSGDIKPTYLDRRTGWEALFPGSFL